MNLLTPPNTYRRGFIFALILGIVVLIVRLFSLSSRMVSVDDSCPLVLAGDEPTPFAAAWKIAQTTTYAPAQFILSSALWPYAQSYSELLFFNRLTSAILGTLGLALSLYVLFKIHDHIQGTFELKSIYFTPYIVFPSSLLLVNLRAHIESQQSYPYAATLLIASLMGYGILELSAIKTPREWIKKAYLVIIGGACMVLVNYQAIFFVIALLLTLYIYLQWQHHWQRFNVSKLHYFGFLSGALLVLLPIYYWFLKRHKNAGKTPWNTLDFPHLAPHIQLSEKIIILTKHLANTCLKLFAYLFAPIWPDIIGHDYLIWCFGFPLFILACMGIFFSFKLLFSPLQKNTYLMPLGVFSFLNLWIALIANMRGFMAIGVTRHAHFLLFPCTILITYGIYYLSTFTQAIKHIGYILSLLIIFLFVYYYPVFLNKTKDQLDVDFLIRTVKEQLIDCVVEYKGTGEISYANRHLKLFNVPVLSHHELHKWMQETEYTQKRPARILIINHKLDFSIDAQYALSRYADYTITTLRQIPAQGSTELYGIINGGNAFYVSLLSLKESNQ